MDKNETKRLKRRRRRIRIRSKVKGTRECPRLSVYKSSSNFYAQLIDDMSGKTLASVHGREVKRPKSDDKGRRGIEEAGFELGKLLAQKAKDKKIKRTVFDRGGYKYHGGVKAIADGAREGGLQF